MLKAVGIATGLTMFACSLAHAEGNAEAGQAAASRWCAECHVISPEDTKALAGAPSFLVLAKDERLTLDYLRTYLLNPHPPMPNPDLPARTIDDLGAYIHSLR